MKRASETVTGRARGAVAALALVTCTPPPAAEPTTEGSTGTSADAGPGTTRGTTGPGMEVTGTTGTPGTTGTTSTPGTTSTTAAVADSTTGPGLDMGMRPDLPLPPDPCEVPGDVDMVGACTVAAPAGSFDPEVEWSWAGDGPVDSVMATPLVANLTDDDGSGTIDLCDTPDIVVAATVPLDPKRSVIGDLYVLDGATGTLHFAFGQPINYTVAPALGDIDGDGLPEIVAVDGMLNRLAAYEHDGTPKWTSPAPGGGLFDAIALADLDADGDVEIMLASRVYDHLGILLWTAPEPAGSQSATTAADLDADGDLEVILGHAAFHHDGTPLWTTPVAPGYPQVADLDGDALPEVLVTNADGLALVEHDGTVTYQGLRPTGVPAGSAWRRPAAVHDLDGDGQPEFTMSSGSDITAYEADATILWNAAGIAVASGGPGAAFDLLGDGSAEALFVDAASLRVLDAMGGTVVQVPRTGYTFAVPVVADVDADGSAEIVVVSRPPNVGAGAPPVQVIRDALDRWVPARRIWNQHTYHVTNVREDGTIPPVEPPSWADHGSFRANAQLEDNEPCTP